jgi:hypothetical protein
MLELTVLCKLIATRHIPLLIRINRRACPLGDTRSWPLSPSLTDRACLKGSGLLSLHRMLTESAEFRVDVRYTYLGVPAKELSGS